MIAVKSKQGRIFVIILIASLLICLLVPVTFMIRNNSRGSAAREDGSGEAGSLTSFGSYISPANNYQSSPSLELCSYDGKLYFVWEKSGFLDLRSYSGWLCMLEDGKIKKVKYLAHNSYLAVLGVADGHLYYHEVNRGYTESELYSYSFETGDITLLSTQELTDSYCVFGEDGAFMVALSLFDRKPITFLRIVGDEVAAVTDNEQDWSFRLGSREYFLADGPRELAAVVYCREESGEVSALPLEWAGRRSLIPTDHGLLVYNSGWSHLLYLIDEEGEVTELFDADCFRSRSAVTVYRDAVYLSVKRYQNGGNFGAGGSESIPDDTMSGTYRISLTDHSVEKLSDAVYDGLFIFDDTGIYACGKPQIYSISIYKLDFDGNVVDTLLENKWSY